MVQTKKHRALKMHLFGVVGLETAFAALLRFYHEGRISAERAVDLMTGGPARVLRQSEAMGTLVGDRAPADLCLVDPLRKWEVTPESLAGRSKNSAFLGQTFQGKVLATFSGGRARYLDPSLA
jgi:dihydroorotase